MTHNEDLEYYFKMGKQDYAHGFHEPFGGIASYLSLKTDRDKEINESYRKGWEYAREQDNCGVI